VVWPQITSCGALRATIFPLLKWFPQEADNSGLQAIFGFLPRSLDCEGRGAPGLQQRYLSLPCSCPVRGLVGASVRLCLARLPRLVRSDRRAVEAHARFHALVAGFSCNFLMVSWTHLAPRFSRPG
jgi:hypothetical protein